MLYPAALGAAAPLRELLTVLDLLGIHVFAVSGALVAVLKELDIVGVLAGGLLCTLWRLLAVRRGWKAPVAAPSL